MRRTLGGMLAVTALAGGCALPYAETPIPTNFRVTKQQKLQAAAHWNMIAHDLGRQLNAKLPQGSRLHVRTSSSREAPFDRALQGQLTTVLVQSGHTVLKTPEAGALHVEIDTQTVAFSAVRPQYRHEGSATALAAGLWAIYEVADRVSLGAAGALTLAYVDAKEWFRSEVASGATPHTEIVVHASVTDANQYLTRSTSVYYVADGDRALYETQPLSPTKTFQVKGEL